MLYTTLLFIDMIKSWDLPRSILSMDVRAVCKLYRRAITVTRLAYHRKLGYEAELEVTSMSNIFREEMDRFRFFQEKLDRSFNLVGYEKWLKLLDKVWDPSIEDTTRVFSRCFRDLSYRQDMPFHVYTDCVLNGVTGNQLFSISDIAP